MPFYPNINDLVILRDEHEHEYPSRVESTAPGELVLGRPLNVLADHAFEPGSELVVTWTSTRGLAALPVQLVDTQIEGQVRLWVVAVTGEAHIEQRRAYVRVQAGGRVLLRPHKTADEDPGEAGVRALVEPGVTGQLADISEGSLRCSVDEASTRDTLGVGVPVNVAFRLGDLALDLAGRVHDRKDDPRSAARVDIVVLFDQPFREADALRKEIFAETLRERLNKPK